MPIITAYHCGYICMHTQAGFKGTVFTSDVPIPSADCLYVSPNTCNGEFGSQGKCCEGSGAATLTVSASLATILFSTLILV